MLVSHTSKRGVFVRGKAGAEKEDNSLDHFHQLCVFFYILIVDLFE
jgi:hypothetical protein